MILFFAAESTGMIKWKLDNHDASQPHMLRLAAVLQDDDGAKVDSMCNLAKPGDDWQFEHHAMQANGLSAGTATAIGIPMFNLLRRFAHMKERASKVVVSSNNFADRIMQREYLAVVGTECVWPGALVDVLRLSQDAMYMSILPKLADAYRHFTKHELPVSTDPIDAGLLKVQAMRTIYRAVKARRP